jgi:hypothetical protein
MSFAMAIVLALPAFAQTPEGSASLADTATLVAKGAAVDVVINYSCMVDPNFGGAAAGDITITQRTSGKRIASGSGYADFGPTCDGTQRSGVVRVRPGEGSGPFSKGDAEARGNLTIIEYNTGYAYVSLTAVVRIK